jgi:hypothetical protein
MSKNDEKPESSAAAKVADEKSAAAPAAVAAAAAPPAKTDLNNNETSENNVDKLTADLSKKLTIDAKSQESQQPQASADTNASAAAADSATNSASDEQVESTGTTEDGEEGEAGDEEDYDPNMHHMSAGSQNDPGKMFIGGLSGQTTPENLKKYFEEFGPVAECMIMKDAITKRSRFVLFTNFIFWSIRRTFGQGFLSSYSQNRSIKPPIRLKFFSLKTRPKRNHRFRFEFQT